MTDFSQPELWRKYSLEMAAMTEESLRVVKPEHRHFINNELVDGTDGMSFDIKNPATGVHIGTFVEAGEKEVNMAVAAARAAYTTGPWSTFTGAQRAKCMLNFADLLEQRSDVLAEWDTKSMGVPITTARTSFYPSCVESFRYYAGYADKIEGMSFPEKNGYYDLVQYEPIGVCAGIAAWNATMIFLGWKIAPALAAGNTVVFKSSEKNPFSTMALGELFKAAGFPPGVVNLLSGGAITGELLASHMEIDKISFTGSGATGRKVQKAATDSNMKKVTLELGGKSAAIVFADANMKTALDGCGDKFLVLSGQACLAASRVLVHKSIVEPFIDGLIQRFKQVAMENPSEAKTTFGPLVDGAQFERVASYIDAAKVDTKIVVGGGRGTRESCYVQPTVFFNPSRQSRIWKEEVFGPVLCVSTFETEKEAIEMANDTTYGLSACVYTENIARALRVAGKMQAGTVAVNNAFWPDIRVPFGGYKQSGQGRESGRAGINEYLQAKTIRIFVGSGEDEDKAETTVDVNTEVGPWPPLSQLDIIDTLDIIGESDLGPTIEENAQELRNRLLYDADHDELNRILGEHLDSSNMRFGDGSEAPIMIKPERRLEQEKEVRRAQQPGFEEARDASMELSLGQSLVSMLDLVLTKMGQGEEVDGQVRLLRELLVAKKPAWAEGIDSD